MFNDDWNELNRRTETFSGKVKRQGTRLMNYIHLVIKVLLSDWKVDVYPY
jgi:hypothetical protein